MKETQKLSARKWVFEFCYWIIACSVLAWFYALDSRAFVERSVSPPDAMTVQVTESDGNWLFRYPNDRRAENQLVLPVDRPVRLQLTSTASVRRFALEEALVHEVVIPGRFTSLWFLPKRLGESPIGCSSACLELPARSSARDNSMQARVTVVEQAAFEVWLDATTHTAPLLPPTPEASNQ